MSDTKTDPDASMVALVLAHSGKTGDMMIRESLRSICNPAGVAGVLVADLDAEAPRPSIPAALADLGGSIVSDVVHLPSMPANDAYAHLKDMALKQGFTHALLFRTHEILKRQSDSQMCEQLPEDWTSADLYQVVSNRIHRPHVDVIIRLEKFDFYGPMTSAPVPVGSVGDLVCRPWPDICVDAQDDSITGVKALFFVALITQNLVVQPDGSPQQQFLELQLLLAYHLAGFDSEADKLLEKRIDMGISGWGGDEGLYMAMFWRALWSPTADSDKKLAMLFRAADYGLSLDPPRFEAVRKFSVVTRSMKGRQKMENLQAVVVAAATAGRHLAAPSAWMGDASVTNFGLNDEAGVAGFYALGGRVQDLVAYQHLLTAKESTGAKWDKRIQTNYMHVRAEGDAHAIRAFLPGISDFVMAKTLVYDDFVTGDPALALATFDKDGIGAYRSLLFILQHALHSPTMMDWLSPPMIIRGNEPPVAEIHTMFGEAGYTVILCFGLDETAGDNVVELVTHELGWESVPTRQAVYDAGFTVEEANTRLEIDTKATASWFPTSTIALKPGRLVAIRAGTFFRVRATGIDTVFLTAQLAYPQGFHTDEVSWTSVV